MNNQLKHHGILGMRWGVINSKNHKSSSNRSLKRNSSDKKINVKNMSDAELRQKINRLQMEQNYTRLSQKKVSAGRKFATAVLIGSATSVANSYVTKYMNSGIKYVGDRLSKNLTGKK